MFFFENWQQLNVRAGQMCFSGNVRPKSNVRAHLNVCYDGIAI